MYFTGFSRDNSFNIWTIIIYKCRLTILFIKTSVAVCFALKINVKILKLECYLLVIYTFGSQKKYCLFTNLFICFHYISMWQFYPKYNSPWKELLFACLLKIATLVLWKPFFIVDKMISQFVFLIDLSIFCNRLYL